MSGLEMVALAVTTAATVGGAAMQASGAAGTAKLQRAAAEERQENARVALRSSTLEQSEQEVQRLRASADAENRLLSGAAAMGWDAGASGSYASIAASDEQMLREDMANISLLGTQRRRSLLAQGRDAAVEADMAKMAGRTAWITGGAKMLGAAAGAYRNFPASTPAAAPASGTGSAR